jgi:hypothetical protein
VFVQDIVVGTVVDLLLDRDARRVLGFEVRCGDEEHRFLPFAAATTAAGRVSASTAFAILDAPQLASYAHAGASLRALLARGALHGPASPPLCDLDLAADGSVATVIPQADAPDPSV